MRFTFNPFDGVDELILIEVKLGEQIQTTQIPLIFAKQQFGQIVMDCSRDNRPVKVSIHKDDFTESGKRIQNSLVFRNKCYISEFGKDG